MSSITASSAAADFIPAAELATLTGRKLKTIYDDHYRGGGPLASILTKFGGRVGAWRADYDALIASQRRLPADGGVRPAA